MSEGTGFVNITNPFQPSRGKRHAWLAAITAVLLLGLGLWLIVTAPASRASEIIVYKSPTCGCCSKWINHLEDNGFKVIAHDRQDMAFVKQQVGLPAQYQSCHTAIVDGYVVEGHVPAADIKRLLTEKPEAYGLAVPGMPMGSPGMEGPRRDHYQVLQIDPAGKASVFSEYK